MSEEKVSWAESADSVSKATFTRIQMIKLPPKLLKPLKMQKRQLEKPKLKLVLIFRKDLVIMVMSVVSFIRIPY